jgi:hypothetical protein
MLASGRSPSTVRAAPMMASMLRRASDRRRRGGFERVSHQAEDIRLTVTLTNRKS